MKTKTVSTGPGKLLRKLALYGVIGLMLLYVALVGGGYGWLRFVRKNDQVRLLDVALIRLGAIRSSIAAQYFVQAQKEWDANKIPAAYLLFSAAVNQDPHNVAGRLVAVQFLRNFGGDKLALVMLEEGLGYTPDDPRLIEASFGFLLTTGRDRRALDLLKKNYRSEYSGKNQTLLQRFEIQATLTADGAPAAKSLLDRYSGLTQDPASGAVVARVLWESRERLKAIGLLKNYVLTPLAVYGDFAELAAWQSASGLTSDAVQTAQRAVAKFPHEPAPRVLLIDTLLAESPKASAAQDAVTAYLRDFGGRPEALVELATFASRRGWVDLSWSLYQVAANRQSDLSVLALSYSDALATESRFKDVLQILAQIESQAPENNSAFMVQLRQRQIINAAARGDSDNVREYARRLASLLIHDPDAIETCRRIFGRMGITDAVTELTSRALTASNASLSKSSATNK